MEDHENEDRKRGRGRGNKIVKRRSYSCDCCLFTSFLLNPSHIHGSRVCETHEAYLAGTSPRRTAEAGGRSGYGWECSWKGGTAASLSIAAASQRGRRRHPRLSRATPLLCTLADRDVTHPRTRLHTERSVRTARKGLMRITLQ